MLATDFVLYFAYDGCKPNNHNYSITNCARKNLMVFNYSKAFIFDIYTASDFIHL